MRLTGRVQWAGSTTWDAAEIRGTIPGALWLGKNLSDAAQLPWCMATVTSWDRREGCESAAAQSPRCRATVAL